MTLRLPLLIAMLLLSAAAPDVAPPPLRLVETISPQGLQEVAPGAIVSTAIIAKPNSVILAGDIVLDWKGERRTFTRGEVIQAGGATGVAGVPEDIFCEPVHEGIGRQGAGRASRFRHRRRRCARLISTRAIACSTRTRIRSSITPS